MDDPWGSPWTTADADKDTKPPSPAKSTRSDLEPPPRAFFSFSGSPRIPVITGPSPWAEEEDGFGDWAAPETPAQTQSRWGGGWVASSPNLTSPPRDDTFGSASPIAWPGNIALPKPANSAVARQPSPDPWSTEFSPSLDGASTPRLIIDAPPLVDKSPTKEEPEALGSPIWKREESDYIQDTWEKDDPGEEPQDKEDKVIRVEPLAPSVSTEHKKPVEYQPSPSLPENGTLRLSVESADQNRRESPSPSGDETDADDDRQDSPITSIDEDAISRQTLERKTSGKVQQLVVKFDGLARAASQEPPVVRRERSKSPLSIGGRDGADDDEPGLGADFGDFNDVQEDASDVPDRGRTKNPDRPATPEVTRQAPTPGITTSVSSPQSTGEPTSIGRAVTIDRTNIKFEVDLEAVDKLFNVDRLSSAEIVGMDEEVSDYILNDSFTEISERKTWYRISRMGSSRKYNAGDDENYRLVTWPTSTIHDDTIKVVRRWMEEDSIAGRVVLGGGVSKTQKNMFGWDSSAETISLDAVFGRKKAHARASSLHSSANGAGVASPSLRSPTHRPSSVVVPPVASFGWSTNSPTWSQPTQSPGIVPAPERTPTAPSAPTIPIPSQPHPSAEVVLPLSVQPATLEPLPVDEDDDEWGEMVASPSEQKPTGDVFGNLDDAFSAPLPSFPAPPPASIPPPAAAEPQFADFAPVTAPAPPPAVDPWAIVDFSVFESTTKPAADPRNPQPAVSFTTPVEPPRPPIPPASSVPSSQPATSWFQPTTPVASKQLAADHAFTPTTPLEIASPQVIPTSEDNYFTPDNSPPIHDDAAVRRIIDNLPDVSFMLR
ncbi:hypothetical protein OQA88_10775 [Cercophora sp. LCS_1]